MDWSKAKTYLIVTFLILDLLLGWQFISAQQEAAGYVQPFTEQVQELRDLLNEHQIRLQAQVPKETPVMSFLRVYHPQESAADIARRHFRDVSVIEDDKSKGSMKFQTAEGEFMATNDGYYHMLYLPQKKIEADSTKLGTHVLQAVVAQVRHAERYREDKVTPDRTTVRYLQWYESYPVFSATLEIHLQNGRIIGYNQKALDIDQPDENGQRVLSAVTAVRAIVEAIAPEQQGEGQQGVTVVQDIQLGYYSPNYQDADVWYLAPMWRIVTDKNAYYVNAFTGQVEKGTS